MDFFDIPSHTTTGGGMNTDLSKFAAGSHVEIVFADKAKARLAKEWLKSLLLDAGIKATWNNGGISFVLNEMFDKATFNRSVCFAIRAIHSVVTHGCYYRVSRFCITQHYYCATDCESTRQGFLELLEVKDSPKGHCKYIVHLFWADTGSEYCELCSLESAQALNDHMINEGSWPQDILGYRLTKVECGKDMPWFYADCDDVIRGNVVAERATS